MNSFDIDINTSVARAARYIVDLKFSIDTEARVSPNIIPEDLHGPSSGGEYGPHFGSSFLSAVLPFIPSSFSNKHSVVMKVPTPYVLGCSWRIWPDPKISIEEKKEVIDYINSNSGVNDTLYTYIPELMIFSAEEGKNRVNFCRFHNIEYIPAKVMIKHYPKAERIKVYVLNIASGLDAWAVLDGQYAKKISHYAYSLPVFRAYGVEIQDSWPIEFPSTIELLKHSSDNLEGFACEGMGIDIIKVREKLLSVENSQKSDNELIVCSLFELDLSLTRMLVIIVSLLFIWWATILIAYTSTHEMVRMTALILCGISTGSLFIALTPILRCQRRMIKPFFKRKTLDNT